MTKVPAQFAKKKADQKKKHAANAKVAAGECSCGKGKDDGKKLPPWMKKK